MQIEWSTADITRALKGYIQSIVESHLFYGGFFLNLQKVCRGSMLFRPWPTLGFMQRHTFTPNKIKTNQQHCYGRRELYVRVVCCRLSFPGWCGICTSWGTLCFFFFFFVGCNAFTENLQHRNFRKIAVAEMGTTMQRRFPVRRIPGALQFMFPSLQGAPNISRNFLLWGRISFRDRNVSAELWGCLILMS